MIRTYDNYNSTQLYSLNTVNEDVKILIPQFCNFESLINLRLTSREWKILSDKTLLLNIVESQLIVQKLAGEIYQRDCYLKKEIIEKDILSFDSTDLPLKLKNILRCRKKCKINNLLKLWSEMLLLRLDEFPVHLLNPIHQIQCKCYLQIGDYLGKTKSIEKAFKKWWNNYGTIDIDSLDLSGVTSIPDQISKIKNLNTLTGSRLMSINKVIKDLTILETFDFVDNYLPAIPDELASLSSLTKLRLENSCISFIPESFKDLTNLKLLDLSYNNLSYIPQSLGNLTKLEDVNFDNNKLNEFPEAICNLINLRVLSICSNRISSFPDSIGALQNLNELSIIQNNISLTPYSFVNLTNITHLHLSNNKFSVIPEFFGSLSNLKSLEICDNLISEIPNSFWQLNLEYLNISNNKIESLSDDITKFDLNFIDISNNPIAELSQKISDYVRDVNDRCNYYGCSSERKELTGNSS